MKTDLDNRENDQVNVSQLIEDSIAMVRDIYKKDGIEIEMESDLGDEIPLIKGNKSKLLQIFMNLISNAKDAVEDSPQKRIDLILQRKANTLKITCKDTGKGMDPSVVNNFVNEFEGQIYVSSEPGEGTEFHLSLPASFIKSSSCAEKSGDQGENQNRTGDQINLISDYPPLSGKVLVVDDEEGIRDILTDLLTSYGLSVWTAENGVEAMDVIRNGEHHFDLVICDMKMPLMDGPRLLNELIKLKIDLPPFIFITGGMNIDFELYKSGFNGIVKTYFYKPFDEERIYAEVAKVLASLKKAS